MKKITILLLTLILLSLGTYGLCGFLAQQNYEMTVTEMQARFPGQISSSFKQGLFTSDMELEIHIPVPDTQAATPPTVIARLSQTIHHGPFILARASAPQAPLRPVRLYGHGTLELAPLMADEPPAVRKLRQLATTDITITAGLAGRTTVTFRSQPRQETLNLGSEALRLNWQGFDGTLKLADTSLLTYDLDVQAPGLEISGNGPVAMAIKDVTTRARMAAGSHNLSLGTVTTTMKRLALNTGSGQQDKVALDDLTVRITSSEEEGGLMRVEEELGMAHLQLAHRRYGPGSLKISLNNLDSKTVAELTEAYQSLPANPANANLMAMGLLSRYATALLAKSPEIRLEKFSLTSPEGSCLTTAHIAFDGSGQVILNPLFLLGRLRAEANFSADERFVAVQAKYLLEQQLCAERRNDPGCEQEAARASSAQLQRLIADNVLQLEDGKYRLRASFQDGQPMLNGRPMPLGF